jgi:hypothetical protein
MVTDNLAIATIADAYNVDISNVAITSVRTYSKHLCIRGKALCGWIDNDGYDIPTDVDKWNKLYCGKCNRYLSMRLEKLARA